MSNFITSKYNNYIRSEGDSYRLARKIQSYWHNLGFTNVKVWVEPFYTTSEEYAEEHEAAPFYSIRSNIKFASA